MVTCLNTLRAFTGSLLRVGTYIGPPLRAMDQWSSFSTFSLRFGSMTTLNPHIRQRCSTKRFMTSCEARFDIWIMAFPNIPTMFCENQHLGLTRAAFCAICWAFKASSVTYWAVTGKIRLSTLASCCNLSGSCDKASTLTISLEGLFLMA